MNIPADVLQIITSTEYYLFSLKIALGLRFIVTASSFFEFKKFLLKQQTCEDKHLALRVCTCTILLFFPISFIFTNTFCITNLLIPFIIGIIFWFIIFYSYNIKYPCKTIFYFANMFYVFSLKFFGLDIHRRIITEYKNQALNIKYADFHTIRRIYSKNIISSGDYFINFVVGYIELISFPIFLRTELYSFIGSWLAFKIAHRLQYNKNTERGLFARYILMNALILIGSFLVYYFSFLKYKVGVNHFFETLYCPF